VTTANIPDDHHMVRHCRHRLYFVRDGNIKPYPDFFHLRPATDKLPAEDSLSGVYYEWFDGSGAEKMKACCHFIGMEIKRKDALLRLNSGLIREQGISIGRRLRVTHEPEADCPPYAAIRGLALEPNNKLCALLAELSVVEALERSTIDAL
jgi:hypothetical protein